jgi:hypothetical protein
MARTLTLRGWGDRAVFHQQETHARPILLPLRARVFVFTFHFMDNFLLPSVSAAPATCAAMSQARAGLSPAATAPLTCPEMPLLSLTLAATPATPAPFAPVLTPGEAAPLGGELGLAAFPAPAPLAATAAEGRTKTSCASPAATLSFHS